MVALIVGVSNWMKDDYTNFYSGVVRAYSGGIFSYYGQASQYNVSRKQLAYVTYPYASRAVVVSGQRFLKKRKENEYNNEKSKKLY